MLRAKNPAVHYEFCVFEAALEGENWEYMRKSWVALINMGIHKSELEEFAKGWHIDGKQIHGITPRGKS